MLRTLTKRLIYKLFTLFIVSLITVLTVAGQEAPQPIHRSSEKVIIGGKVYYIHVVKKGQTLYSISKVYNVPQKRISRENPILVTGLQEGMILKIPYAPEVENVNQSETRKCDTRHYIYHSFEEGETLYSLSKKYDVSVEDILKANPGIKPEDIPIGMEIKIPWNPVTPERIEFSSQQEKYKVHKVVRGETLYSIARQYRVTVNELSKINDNLKESIHPGQEIHIPEAEQPSALFEKQMKDSVNFSVYYEKPIPCDTIPLLGAEKEWKVAIMLPLYLEKNSERSYIDSSRIDPSTGKRIKKLIRREPDWIYPHTVNFLSFYEGVMMGLDTLGKQDIHAEVTIFDTERNASVVDSLLKSGALDDMNLIIGPVYPSNLSLVADWARNRRIPVVSPLSRNDEFLYFNPYAFECRPSKRTEWIQVIRYLARNLDKNIVIIHHEDTLVQKNYEWVKGQLLEEISHYAHPEMVVIKEVVIPSIISPTDTMNNIRLSLDKDRENLVWVFSDQEGFVSEVSSRLNTVFFKDYPIKLMGGSAWRYFENIELDYFFRLNLRLFTPRFIDYTGNKEKIFVKKFRARYYTDPSALSLTWDGYDIVTWFLSALFRFGSSFPDCASSFHPPICIGDFTFGRTGWFSGFMNQSFQLIQYNKDYTISVVPFP
ncbi:MAG TPA: LysM peptidoglycan-binding domain-containing protein [Bacteroidetes bacterium]|nr:LysM peptidoglycan-binding domain-containing protein [Bacteroidota bacterium]